MPAAAPTGNGLASARVLIAFLLPLLVLVQAAMASWSNRLFGTWDIVAHGVVGNASFAVAVVGAALAWAVPARPAERLTIAAITALMVVQIGLGYTGRTSLVAAAWHVPLGVALFGLTVHHLGLVGPRRRAVKPARPV